MLDECSPKDADADAGLLVGHPLNDDSLDDAFEEPPESVDDILHLPETDPGRGGLVVAKLPGARERHGAVLCTVLELSATAQPVELQPQKVLLLGSAPAPRPVSMGAVTDGAPRRAVPVSSQSLISQLSSTTN